MIGAAAWVVVLVVIGVDIAWTRRFGESAPMVVVLGVGALGVPLASAALVFGGLR